MEDQKLLELLKKHGAFKRKSKGYYQSREELFKLITQRYSKDLKNTAQHWNLSLRDIAECESLVNLGILKAIERFDERRAKKFTTFLWTTVRNLLTDEWRRQHRTVPFLPIDNDYSGECDAFAIPSFEAPLADKLLVEKLLSLMTPDEQAVTRALLAGVTPERAPALTNFGKDKIWRVIRQIKAKYTSIYQQEQ